jgi:hypothetical protein
VVAGTFTGTLTLGNFTLTNASSDIFVARLNAAGQWTQAVSAGGTGTKTVRALALDAGGGVVVAGTYTDMVATFGTIMLTNGSVFVARLSIAGQWTQAATGGPSAATVNGLAVNKINGTATVTGSFGGRTCTFGTHSLTGSSSVTLFVARLNTSGTWTQAVGVIGGGHSASGVALDAIGNAVVTGFFLGGSTVKFGSTTLYSPSSTAFVARLSITGTWTQAVQANSNGGFAAGASVAVDANDNVVITGNFRDGNVSFGSTTLTYVPSHDNIFVARLSSTGMWTQAAQASGSGYSFPEGLSLSADGSAWVAGVFGSPTISFGSTMLTNVSTIIPPNTTLATDVFVARLSAAGSWTYAAQAGGPSYDYPVAVLLDGSRVLVVGAFGSPASFGPVTLTTPVSLAGFVAGIGGGTLSSSAPTAGSAMLTLAPNPATATTVLTLPASAAPRPVQVFDMLGRVVRTQLVAAHATAATLNVAGLKPGIYLVSCDAHSQRLAVE